MSHRNLSKLAGLVLIVLASQSCFAADAVSSRIDKNIDAGWKFLRSDAPGAEAAAFDDAGWKSVDLPYTWLPEESNGRMEYYSGPSWYRSHLNVDADLANKSLFLRFGAAPRIAKVYVNGQSAGTHQGAFGAFCMDVTKLVHPGDNVIAVRVDNSLNKNVAPLSGDFTTYGGLIREVHLLALNPVSITPLDDAGPGAYLKTNVTDARANVEVTTKLRNATDKDAEVTIVCSIADASGKEVQHSSTKKSVPANGAADAVTKLVVDHPHLWNGRIDPYLYQATIEVAQGNTTLDRIVQPLGLRYFNVDQDRGVSLNGKPYDLHGVNYHEGRVAVGFADTPEMEEEDNKLICDMGCTIVRMAHYQHNEYEYTLCDRSGVVVWTELALVNKMTDTPEFKENIKQQLRELIKQNYNHPSVFFWSMYNEPWVNPEAGTQEQWHLVDDLVKIAHELDPTRLTTGAVVGGMDSALNWYMDVPGINRYSGWYGGPPEEWPKTIAGLRSYHSPKPIGLSEYGGGASVLQHQNRPAHPTPASKWHPEEWQAIVHEHAWAAMERQNWLWCKLIWCMFDFSSSGRNEGDSPGINDKGLVTADRKTLKDAYFYYKANWTTEPFAYITDRRFNPRPPGASDLKVYSNCPTVELIVNGHSLGSQTRPNHIFSWPNIELPAGNIDVQAVGTSEGKTYNDSLSWNVVKGVTTRPAN